MSLLTTLKNTFLPSESVSAARRLETFGSESKTGAAVKIIGTAAAIGTGGAALGLSGTAAKTAVTTAIKSTVSKVAAKTTLKGVAKTVIAAPIVVGLGNAIINEPKPAAKAAVKYYESAIDYSGDVYKTAINPTKEGVIALFNEHPFLTTATVGGGAVILGKGITSAYTAVKLSTLGQEKSSMDNITESAKSLYNNVTLPETGTGKTDIPATTPPENKPTPETNKTGVAPVPLTPETQIVGKEAGTRSITKHKQTKNKNPIMSTRINIINQSKLFQTKKYIY